MRLTACLLIAASVAAQTLVVDRALTGDSTIAQPVERGARGAYADAFQIGAKGEVWMIDSIRLWAVPAVSPACPRQLGDQVEKVTLFGALDNPPIPGQPVCDCHALVAIAAVPLAPGGAVSLNPNVTLAPRDSVWQFDFRNVRWSVPGAMDALFTLRAAARQPKLCDAAAGWALAASPAPAAYKLHLLDEKGVPVGLEPARSQPRTVRIQVWAHRTQ